MKVHLLPFREYGRVFGHGHQGIGGRRHPVLVHADVAFLQDAADVGRRVRHAGEVRAACETGPHPQGHQDIFQIRPILEAEFGHHQIHFGDAFIASRQQFPDLIRIAQQTFQGHAFVRQHEHHGPHLVQGQGIAQEPFAADDASVPILPAHILDLPLPVKSIENAFLRQVLVESFYAL